MAVERKFIVTTPSETIRLDAEGHGNAVFTVSSTAGDAEGVLVRAVPLGDTRAEWLSIPGNAERTFPSGGSQQIKVEISVPPGTAPARYRFRLDIVSAQRGGEDREEGPPVAIEVAAPKPVKKDRWWLWIAAAALVAIVLLGVYLRFFRPEPDPVPEPVPVVERVPLRGFWNGERGDNMTVATPESEGVAQTWGYTPTGRIEGYVFPTQQPGTVPLILYFNQDRGDFFTTASDIGIGSAKLADYAIQRVEGYVYPTQQPGTVPLILFWLEAAQDNYTAGSPEGQTAARNSGYAEVRVEGYVFTSPR